MVRTDQRRLKHFLDQKVGTLMQQNQITKLLGYDLVVEYKRESKNRDVDALSRNGKKGEGTLMLITFPNTK